MNKSKKIENGYVVITTTLILLMVTVGIIATLAMLSGGNSKIALSRIAGEQALAWSDSCQEEGMLRLKADPTYSGGDVNFPQGKCHLVVTNDGQAYTIQASFVGEKKYSRSIESQTKIINGSLQIISWDEKFFVIN